MYSLSLVTALGQGADAMMADSPFTVYTASAVIYILIVMVLVLTLFVGAFLVVNLGLMSKRQEDEIHTGGVPEPSEVGFLHSERFHHHVPRPALPAEEGAPIQRSDPNQYAEFEDEGRNLLQEDQMRPDVRIKAPTKPRAA
jgi:hypothetical protein